MKKIFVVTGLFILSLGVFVIFSYQPTPSFKDKHLKRYSSEFRWEQRLASKKKQKDLGISKFDNPSEFAKYFKQIHTGYGVYNKDYPINYRNAALQLALQDEKTFRTSAATNWTERGPANVPGRTRALVIDPTDATGRTWIAGAVGGGIWRTTDEGANWENLTPDLPNIAISSLALCTSSPSVIYAGTGEGISIGGIDGIDGDGIFKSTNGGDDWTQLTSTINTEDFANVNRLVVDPNDPDLIVAATEHSRINFFRSGIYRSVNGGSTWTKVYTGSGGRAVQQIVADPLDFNVLYATQNRTGILKSTDAGATWASTTVGMSFEGRLEMAISPVNPQKLFISAEGTKSGNESDLYVSSDGGATWDLTLEANDEENVDFLGGQGSYDNTIVAHPYDEDIVYFGGVNLWKATVGDDNVEGIKTVNSVDEINTSFLTLINFGGVFFNGFIDEVTLPVNSLASVEIRFGPGLSQKAHRFTVNGIGAGAAASDYDYQDYVDVPFEVWDIDNNQQLMVSFRDQQDDGEFTLAEANTAGAANTHSREYVYIHDVNYSATEDSNIATDGGSNQGHTYNGMYFLWPVLSTGSTWNPGSLPSSQLNIVYGGTLGKSKTTEVVTDAYGQNGGTNSFTQFLNVDFLSGVHPDHHGLHTFKVNETAQTFKIINTNDGGVYYSDSGTDPGVTDGDWNFAGNGYNTSQFYGIDKKPGAEEYLGGMQDNGSWRTKPGENSSSASKYLRVQGGDGFEAIWHNLDPNKLLVTTQFNGIFQSNDGGASTINVSNGIPTSDRGPGDSPFITKISNSRSNPDKVYAIGKSGVWISENFGTSWSLTPLESDFNVSATSIVKVSKANINVVWAGSGMTNGNKMHVSTDGGITFEPTENYDNFASVSGFATHPIEDSTAYALFSVAGSPKVLKTIDLGVTWEDLTGFEGSNISSNGFPDVSAYCLLVMPHDPNQIWVGTDIGIIESLDAGLSWQLLQDNLPGTSIWDIKTQDDEVIIASHGRGIWTTTIADLPAPTFVPIITQSGFGIDGSLNLVVDLRSEYDSTEVLVDGEKVDGLGPNQIGTQQFNISGLPTEELLEIQIKSLIDDNPYLSNIVILGTTAPIEPVDFYENDFDDLNEDDFSGNGFSISLETGFFSGAINSLHDYNQNTDYIYQLNVPVTIAATESTFEYDDVAIVETGEASAVFPATDFYDYVVVEGSTDGINWIAIEDGYDASFSDDWEIAYDNDEVGNASLFVEHKIDLLETFNPGDEVIFRFRLHSDAGLTSWGWIIDNLYIQSEKPPLTVVGLNEVMESGITLSHFPNPAKDKITVQFSLPSKTPLSIKIVGLDGRVLNDKFVSKGQVLPGVNELQFEINGLSPGMYFLLMETQHRQMTSPLIITK